MSYRDKELPRLWRQRAEELRSKASQFNEPIARKGLEDAAQFYDQLADQAENTGKTTESRADRDRPNRE